MHITLQNAFRTAMTIAAATGVFIATPAHAASIALDNTAIVAVNVNGGTDTANPGTTCVRVSAPISAACTAGFVAIQNNNKLLIAAALQAKASASNTWFYYNDSGTPVFHCPGMVMTPCSVISIEIK